MKIATRYLLPLEIFMSLQMLAWGIAGAFGGGMLWQTLGRVEQNTAWGLVLGLVGAVQLVVTALEWGVGRRWADAHLLRSVSWRVWSAFFGAAVWFYVCYMLATLPQVADLVMLSIQAPVAVLFSLWIWTENMKVACVLDPSVPTAGLQRRLALERRISGDDTVPFSTR